MRRTLTNLLLATVFFFCIFNLKFSFLPFYTQRIIVGIGFLHVTISFLLNPNKFYIRDTIKFLPIILFILFFVYSSLCFITQNSSDNSMVVSSLLMLLQVSLSIYYIKYLCIIKMVDFDRVIEIISFVFLIQSCAIIIFFISSGFREIVSSILPLESGAEEWTFRSRGLTHGGGSLLGLLQGIGVLLSFYAFFFSKTLIKRILYSFYIATISISIVLSGRIGFLIFPLILIFIILFSIFYSSFRKGIILKCLSLLTVISCCAGIFLLTYILFFAWENEYGTDGLLNTLYWAFGEFIDFNEDRYQDKENWATISSLLGTHLYFPKSFTRWVFGDSNSWLAMNAYSDMGYIRILYTNGLFGSFFLYGGYLSLFIIAIISSKCNHKFIFTILSIYLLIAETKEPFLLKFSVPTICLILFLTLDSRTVCRFNKSN